MQNGTKKKKGLGAILCAGVVLALAGVYLGVLLFSAVAELWSVPMVMGIVAIYGLAVLAVMAGVLAALVQRLREIQRGEEEDASKY